ncbi:MAG: hypothetical protein GY800_01005 [Planctomycetes bacterium]|nr:hypothetical protein [Planctomycetota bacterium]
MPSNSSISNQSHQVLFDTGLAAGLSPDSILARSPQGKKESDRHTTGLRSRWLHRRCLVCGHSFRVGDEVVILSEGDVVHDMPGLRCLTGNPDKDNQSASNFVGDFFVGLNDAWPMPQDVFVQRLEPGHYLLTPPHGGHERTSCRICGHTFRPSDHVVICPCSPERPKCRAAIHRDTLRQLHCWDEWMRERSKDICLGMS